MNQDTIQPEQPIEQAYFFPNNGGKKIMATSIVEAQEKLLAETVVEPQD